MITRQETEARPECLDILRNLHRVGQHHRSKLFRKTFMTTLDLLYHTTDTK